MSVIPKCKHCGAGMRQIARYSDWTCECCDESAKCPHVSGWKRFKRKLTGRRV